jgi:hypothetical protein
MMIGFLVRERQFNSNRLLNCRVSVCVRAFGDANVLEWITYSKERMSRTVVGGSTEEWSHLCGDHQLCSPSRCEVACARDGELVKGIRESGWVDELSGGFIPEGSIPEVLDDPVLAERYLVLEDEVREKLISSKGGSLPRDVDSVEIGEPPAYSFDDEEVALEFGSGYVLE